MSLSGASLVIAEGIFAHHVVGRLREAGLLAAAYCLRQHPVVTFWRRLTRDLREHRKPPLVLVRRGIALARDQRRIVAEAVAAGCTAVSADEAYALVQQLRCRGDPRMNLDAIRGLAQPDQRSCGPSSLVAAHILLDPAYAATQNPHAFAGSVLDLHRQLTAPSAFGRAQLPWPRALGTPPWAVARAMGEYSGVHYATTLVPFHNRESPLRPARRRRGRPAGPLLHRRLDPPPRRAGGRAHRRGRAGLQPGRRHPGGDEACRVRGRKLTTFGRWTRPWFLVLPD